MVPPDTADLTPDDLDGALDSMWVEAAATFSTRVGAIEDHIVGLLNEDCDDRCRADAVSAAHKLAGTMGMFGMAAGSVMALELEQLLEGEESPTLAQLERASRRTRP